MLNRHPFASGGDVRTLTVRDFELRSGAIVEEARLGYCVFGDPSDPITVLHTAVSGNPRAYAETKTGYGDGWWNRHFGPDEMFDPSRSCIICVSHFGGNGPSSTADELAAHRRDLSIVDTAHLTARALREAGIARIHAAVGVSMGGAVAREWMFQNDVALDRIVEIFANFGNNFIGATAKDYCHIQIDLLYSDGTDLDAIRTRIEANCGAMTREAPAFAEAYAFVMREYETLYEDFSDENVLRVTRMIGFFRFVTPHFFQAKWDAAHNETGDRAAADAALQDYWRALGATFVKTFKRSSLACLRFMDATPAPYDPARVARAIREKNLSVLGLIVRGDRLYDPALQFGYYEGLRDALPEPERSRVRTHLCSDVMRGHDRFLSPDFKAEGRVIRDFLAP